MTRATLGARLQTYRERQELSRAALAERAGVKESLIAAVEEEGLAPSLGPLLKISRALGIRLGTLLDDHEVHDPVIVRLDERAEGLTTRGVGQHASLRFHSLGQGKSDRHMEPFYIEIQPEDSATPPELSSHQGEEFIVVLSGQVGLLYGREKHVLSAGDSLYFNSIVPHHIGAEGNTKAEIYAVLYFPE